MLMEPSNNAFDVSLRAANMCLNRFCIDEDAGYECSGVYDLKEGYVLYKDGNELYVPMVGEYELPSQQMYERIFQSKAIFQSKTIGRDSYFPKNFISI